VEVEETVDETFGALLALGFDPILPAQFGIRGVWVGKTCFLNK
jgi:hypothetical protein